MPGESELVLGIDGSRDSQRALALLRMTGLPFRIRDGELPEQGYPVPWLYYRNNSYHGLRNVGGVEWIMKGYAPLAFDMYVHGTFPPEYSRGGIKCVLSEELPLSEQLSLSVGSRDLLK